MEGLGVVDRGFWRGKRVLVTGHTGFKGAWLALWLEKLGAKVTGFSLGVPTKPSLFEALVPGSSWATIEGDIRSRPALKDAFAAAKPEIVFHLAAQSLVRLSYEEPLMTLETNVIGTANVLDVARSSAGVRAVVNVTSDKCYENREWPYAYRENDPFGGRDPYSCSKGCAELVTAAFRQSYFAGVGCGLASVRAGNVIGGGDWSADRLVPDCMRAFSQGQQVVVRNPAAVRPWQHVLEALRGYLILGQRLFAEPERYSAGYNFGPDAADSRPVSHIVESLCSGWGEGARFAVEQPSKESRPHEAHLLKLDSSFARAALGWHPVLELPEALSLTVAWYRQFYGGAAMRSISLDQLNSIEAREARAQ